MLLAMLPNLSVSASAALRWPLLRCRGQPTSATRRRRAMISAVRVGQAAGSERRRAYGSVLSAPARSTLSAGARYAVDAGSAAGRLLEYDVRFSLRPCQSGKHGKRSSKQLRRSDGRGAANRPGAAMRARRCVRTVHRAFVERAPAGGVRRAQHGIRMPLHSPVGVGERRFSSVASRLSARRALLWASVACGAAARSELGPRVT